MHLWRKNTIVLYTEEEDVEVCVPKKDAARLRLRRLHLH